MNNHLKLRLAYAWWMLLGSVSVIAAEQTDVEAMAALQEHHWWYLKEAHVFSREEILSLDPWAAFGPGGPDIERPILGLVWDGYGHLVQILPGSAADKAGITENNLAGTNVPEESMATTDSVVCRLRDGTRRVVRKAVWHEPTLWLGEGGRVRIYWIDQQGGAKWRNLLSATRTNLLDLRGSRGGYTEATLEILGTFLGPDRIVAKYQTRDEYRRVRSSYLLTPSNAEKVLDPRQWVILVDHHTASAAELLAYGLEAYGARVTGKPTYGKHCTQDWVTFRDGSWMSFTVGWFED